MKKIKKFGAIGLCAAICIGCFSGLSKLTATENVISRADYQVRTSSDGEATA
ncbi:MAG: hypothetical protein IJY62_03210 [Clostridia bacterium]|nr:hypothetical protein [Clostridia bacterium]